MKENATATASVTAATLPLTNVKTGESSPCLTNGDGIETEGHAKDFRNKFGINREQVPHFLKMVIANGELLSNKPVKIGARIGYERIYRYGNATILIGVGSNGFVVTAYPKTWEGGE